MTGDNNDYRVRYFSLKDIRTGRVEVLWREVRGPEYLEMQRLTSTGWVTDSSGFAHTGIGGAVEFDDIEDPFAKIREELAREGWELEDMADVWTKPI